MANQFLLLLNNYSLRQYGASVDITKVRLDEYFKRKTNDKK